jgi:tripartite-type tricarboxylate transporter receptor subunit TctC
MVAAFGTNLATAEENNWYKGKQMSLIAPAGVGGGYDLYARVLAHHIGKFIPGNPAVVVQNMPGAGGIAAANYLYAVAPPDGLTFGLFQNTITLNQLTQMSGVHFDVRRFSWIGNMSVASTICALSGEAKNMNAKDLFDKPVVIGAATGSPTMIPTVLNQLAGTKFKIVSGYPSTSNVQLAMEAGEVSGLCGWSWDGARVTGKEMFDHDKAHVVLDIAIQPQRELKAMGVPFLMDLLPDGEKKEALKVILSTQVYNRPFAAPPKVPEDRLAVLKSAFKRTLADPLFREEADKLGLYVEYFDDKGISRLIDEALEAPEQVRNIAVRQLKEAGF